MLNDDYKPVVQALVSDWRISGVEMNAGADDAKLDKFELMWGVRLPEAFRYLYSLVDGTPDSDSRLFELWSLDAINENKGVTRDSKATRICFGDFLIDSHRYYLVVESDLGVSVFVDEINETVADSFAEFIFLMLRDPGRVYLMPAESKLTA